MNEIDLLAGEVGVSGRTLRRAVNQGTLRASRSGPRTLELPVSERVYVRRSWSLIAALRSALRTESNVRFALLYGSAARGTDTAGADVDVLVDLHDSSLERLMDVRVKLADAVCRPIDIARLADAERDPTFLAEALQDGRVLIDRVGLWPSLRRRKSLLRGLGEQRMHRRAQDALAGIDRLLATRHG